LIDIITGEVELSPSEKAAIGQPSAPGWELDVVASRV
jgi:hypothetical protein